MLPYGLFFLIALVAAGILLFPVRQHRVFIVVIGIMLVVSALGLYHFVGTPEIIEASATRAEKLKSARQVILSESKKLQENKKDLEGWVRLGQAFAQTSKYSEAARAFKEAILLSGGHPELIMAYARSLIMASDGQVDDHAEKSLKMVLLQKPQHEEARYYMAVRLLQNGQNSEAMKAMKNLYNTLPDDSPVRAMINQQIGRE